jgi:threonine dehydrogenase-like Zn-dependent dehydrogenase
MKALRSYAFGDLRVDEVPLPELRPGWVFAKVRVVQASVTEAQRAYGIPTSGLETIRKLIEEKAPIKLFGHEFSAQVMEVGEGVTSLKVGDRVASGSRMPCHQCNACLSGHPERCHKGPSVGRQIPGGFADFVVLPEEILVKLPASISDNEGASIQPASSALTAITAADIDPGDTVVVLGQGCMGNYVMQMARCSGAGKVITTDVREEALELSKRLGADHVIDARANDPKKLVMEMTNGTGADIVFEAAGGDPSVGLDGDRTLQTCFEIVRDEGKVVQIAYAGSKVVLNIDRIRERGIKYFTPAAGSQRLLRHTVDLAATNRLQLKPLITHVLEGLDKAPQAIEMTLHKAQYKMMNPVQVVVSRG